VSGLREMERSQVCLKGTNIYDDAGDFGRHRRVCEIRVEDDEQEGVMGPVGILKP
jgi:hypothetical protein